jgi:hypothetical protein
VAKAEAVKRREEYKQLLGYTFTELNKKLEPLLEQVRALSTRTQLQDLTTNVPDYNDNLREQVISWVDKQPSYLQTAYKQVIEQGTADEVVDLINRYKADTGSRQTNTAPAKKKTELPTATKQAAAALAPVSSKRSGATNVIDPSDFDSAFTAAAKELS